MTCVPPQLLGRVAWPIEVFLCDLCSPTVARACGLAYRGVPVDLCSPTVARACDGGPGL